MFSKEIVEVAIQNLKPRLAAASSGELEELKIVSACSRQLESARCMATFIDLIVGILQARLSSAQLSCMYGRPLSYRAAAQL